MKNRKYTETGISQVEAPTQGQTQQEAGRIRKKIARVKTQPRDILLIVNPASKSGLGRAYGQLALDFLRSCVGADAVRMEYTQSARHAIELASVAAKKYAEGGKEDIFVLGGDGVIHEVANGLLTFASRHGDVHGKEVVTPHGDEYFARSANYTSPASNPNGGTNILTSGQGIRPRAESPSPSPLIPALGVIPVGSGNDYARALGVSTDTRLACRQLLDGRAKYVDAGRVNDTFFVETLSFGVDAAIALATMELRAKAGKSTPTLYIRAGIDQIVNHRDTHYYVASFDGGAPVESSSFTFAVQIGPFYGGGFKIAPAAALDDGFFDICIAHPPLSLPGALRLFAKAKSGKHTNDPRVEILQARHIDLAFTDHPPAQTDGEPVYGTDFAIDILPSALKVIIPEGK